MSTRKISAASSKTEFTLIELLVVIAIIAILASILLPALSKARARGYSADCLAKIKSLNAGASMYAGDNGDYIVPYGTGEMADPYYGNIWTGSFNPTRDYYFKLVPYLGKEDLYVYNRSSYVFSASNNKKRSCLANTLMGIRPNIGWNQMMGTYNYETGVVTRPMRKLNMFRRPSQIVTSGDSMNSAGFYCASVPAVPPTTAGSGEAAFPHGSAGNFGHVDGHAESYTFSRWICGQEFAAGYLRAVCLSRCYFVER